MLKVKMMKVAVAGAVVLVAGAAWAQERELAGVTFPEEKQVAGHALKLNGVALRKAMVVVKVFAGGFYLEQPTQDAETAIESEQVKHFHLHYLTSKATARSCGTGSSRPSPRPIRRSWWRRTRLRSTNTPSGWIPT